ncbi:MAG: integral membrane protein-like protein [uncultured bacterium]|uniref:Membrane protein 6-pyruvoyl-tetrahydropterin synthase-related domain-containing protein n=1 Tax=Candidatus Daviesbacteria bacterium GW2011_GWC2_40_12 TaxID=1618431 RepID=A0A0G0QQC5_9BACT|nr:MAG: integral membrane protein-like protein [uncultured bacterium]KKR17210.1 MAG: hypothetical protein UT45_C0002G0039 [Candidatus Daviesbacteria bacterium GW2011_GWA2_39_33]KKR42609.1 MAG: hypothetical protein UT77_C0001G0060 [Candidatus Daviesbacteria bacterium GW2011_GWC2_40_12]OGE21284.1 MAG: hypothetical protein A2778_03905 [Candidatus Daviesbacteria bacterium RIFCSPHIGHO2_01_FULL_40_24]OGE30198.1 MAG: hypothetical protein A3C29_02215 [Candidatus Daviesbacteria bacterium RIFCSPHIGHO2_02
MARINLKNFNLKNIIWVALVLLSIIPATWALFVPGFYGASDDLHIAWLFEFHKAFMMGQIPPRFVPDLSFSFGYPLFNFVFPLPFYIGEFFHLLGLSFVDSIKAVFFISVPLSGAFMYLLLRQFSGKSLSLIGALVYVYAPYRAVDLYIRGAIGEIVSFIFLPLIILSLVKIYQAGSFGWIGTGGLALASLVLSHNITAYMFFPFVGLLIILQFFLTSSKKQYFAKVGLMIFLGFLTSIFFWLPALIESDLVKYDTVFNFVDHFPTFLQLITPYWGYGASVPGPGDGMSFFLGGANILILIGGFLLFIFKYKEIENQKKVFIVWALSAIAVAIFLMNYRSIIVWNKFPLLPYFQFPWRFLILTTFFIPLLLVIFEKLRMKRYLFIILSLIVMLPAMFYFRPQDFLGRVDEYYLNRYIPHPSVSEEYKKTQEEYLRLPKDTQMRPNRIYPRATSEDPSINEIIVLNDLDAVLKIASDKGTVINYNKYYFPGWVVKIDDKITEISPGLPFGQITFFVPAGTHNVNVNFEETLFKKTLNAISFSSFLVSLWLVKNLWIRSKKSGHLS